MIEDYQAKRRRSRRLSRLLLAAGLVLALVAAVVTYVFASGLGTLPPTVAPRTASVVVAARNLEPRTTITSADLRTIDTSVNLVPTGALTSTSEAIGKVVTVPIAAGEIVTPNKYRDQEGFGFSVLPPGQRPQGTTPEYRAMSITVANERAVGGAVQAGDVVDIVFGVPVPGASPAPTTEVPPDTAAKIVYQQIPILQRSETTYTIRVTAAQAEEIVALSGAGATIDFLLRAADDTRPVQAGGARQSTEVGDLIRGIGTSPSPAPR